MIRLCHQLKHVPFDISTLHMLKLMTKAGGRGSVVTSRKAALLCPLLTNIN